MSQVRLLNLTQALYIPYLLLYALPHLLPHALHIHKKEFSILNIQILCSKMKNYYGIVKFYYDKKQKIERGDMGYIAYL